MTLNYLLFIPLVFRMLWPSLPKLVSNTVYPKVAILHVVTKTRIQK